MALFEPSCVEAYGDVFSDDNDADFCVLGYEGRKLTCVGRGTGGLDAIIAASGLNIISAANLDEAAAKAVAEISA